MKDQSCCGSGPSPTRRCLAHPLPLLLLLLLLLPVTAAGLPSCCWWWCGGCKCVLLPWRCCCQPACMALSAVLPPCAPPCPVAADDRLTGSRPLVVLAGSRDTRPMLTSTATAITDRTPPQCTPAGSRKPCENGAPAVAAAAAQLVAAGGLDGLGCLLSGFCCLLLLCSLELLHALSLQLPASSAAWPAAVSAAGCIQPCGCGCGCCCLLLVAADDDDMMDLSPPKSYMGSGRNHSRPECSTIPTHWRMHLLLSRQAGHNEACNRPQHAANSDRQQTRAHLLLVLLLARSLVSHAPAFLLL